MGSGVLYSALVKIMLQMTRAQLSSAIIQHASRSQLIEMPTALMMIAEMNFSTRSKFGLQLNLALISKAVIEVTSRPAKRVQR